MVSFEKRGYESMKAITGDREQARIYVKIVPSFDERSILRQVSSTIDEYGGDCM